MHQPSKKILALDGGGIRGIVELAFLERIESILQESAPNPDAFRLCDYFDLVGGTSTGAIIAAALSTGRKVSYVRSLYDELASKIFRKEWWRIAGIQSRFASKPLASVLLREFGDVCLDDPGIKTRLGIVTKRLDTGSPWIVSNVPSQPYWNDPDDKAFCGNRHLKLRSIIRASTAAPYYFGPESIPISTETDVGIFVDGGVTPYNDPAIPLLMLATFASFGLRWPMSRDELLLVSIGTGSFRDLVSKNGLGFKPAGQFALKALHGLIGDCRVASQTMLQWVSYSPSPWKINSEIGDLDGEYIAGQPLLTYQRYDIKLESAWLKENLGFDIPDKDIAKLRPLDAPANMPVLHELATQAAKMQVKKEHFDGCFGIKF